MKDFHEVHVVVAVLLHLDKQCQLWCSLLTKRYKQLAVYLLVYSTKNGHSVQ